MTSCPPRAENGSETAVIQVYPVVSPLPPPGKTMFPKFPRGAAQSSSQRARADAARGSPWELRLSGRGPASGPAWGPCVSVSPRPRSGAPLTLPQTLSSAPHPGPLQILTVLEPRRETIRRQWWSSSVQHLPGVRLHSQGQGAQRGWVTNEVTQVTEELGFEPQTPPSSSLVPPSTR